MKFGIFSHVAWPEGSSPKQAYDDKIQQVLCAEDWGFHSSWLAEHHFTRYGAISSLPQFLTYLATKTDRIRQGTAVSVLPVHDPIVLAEEFATLDGLSNGRLDVGVGRGFSPAEDAVFSIDRDQTHKMYLESVDVNGGLWTTPGFSFHGEYHNLDNVTLVPQRVQQPHLPLYMSAYQEPLRHPLGLPKLAKGQPIRIVVRGIPGEEGNIWHTRYGGCQDQMAPKYLQRSALDRRFFGRHSGTGQGA